MSDERAVPQVVLNDGVRIPQLGFGVYKVESEQTRDVVGEALRVGYRSIDTAALYGNERGVGEAIRDSGLPRDEVFVTTKLWNDRQGRDRTLAAFEQSLTELGLDHVDLYLIHWPAPSQDLYVETWQTFIELRDSGRVRSIGVSNFQPSHLRRLVEETGVVPSLNQVELHPFLQQHEVRAVDAELGIATEAWGPLARGGELLHHPVVTAIAQRHGRSPAQVVIAWHLRLGNVVIPKSVTPARIEENFNVFDLHLTDEDLAAIADLDAGLRTGPDPDELG
jgi:diketogulonate reductase-like aldo/keto reductase